MNECRCARQQRPLFRQRRFRLPSPPDPSAATNPNPDEWIAHLLNFLKYQDPFAFHASTVSSRATNIWDLIFKGMN